MSLKQLGPLVAEEKQFEKLVISFYNLGIKVKSYNTWITGIQVDKNFNTSLINMYVLSPTLTLLPRVALPAVINRLLFILVEK